MQGDRLQVQTAIKIDRGHDVSLHAGKPHVFKMSLEGYTYCKVGTIPLTPCVAPGVAAGVAGVTPLPFWP
jgi:hypothetical protein